MLFFFASPNSTYFCQHPIYAKHVRTRPKRLFNFIYTSQLHLRKNKTTDANTPMSPPIPLPPQKPSLLPLPFPSPPLPSHSMVTLCYRGIKCCLLTTPFSVVNAPLFFDLCRGGLEHKSHMAGYFLISRIIPRRKADHVSVIGGDSDWLCVYRAWHHGRGHRHDLLGSG